MSLAVRLRSLAKINLDLQVLNKRPDGFHNLRTIFQTVTLADAIEIDYVPSRRLTVELTSNVEIEGNLIEKAAEALGIPGRFRIRLTKRIPMGGGLGGGSSNAAAMLLAIPALTRKPVKLQRLIEIGAQLGSDVPYFLLGGTALGLARGTDLVPLPDLPAYLGILVAPNIHVSTPSAYSDLNRAVSEAPAADSRPLWELGWTPPGSWAFSNDFETVVFAREPRLKSIKAQLQKAGAGLALMSGSGSTVFGIFEHRAVRDPAVVSLRRKLGKDVGVFPVALVGRSRYRSLWRRQLRISDAGASGAAREFLERTWPPQNRYE